MVRKGGGGTEMPNIGLEGRSDPEKKNCDLAQTGVILGREDQEAGLSFLQ